MGEEIKIESIAKITLPEPERKNEAITGEIIHIDSFGNLISNIPVELLDSADDFPAFPERGQLRVRIKEREINGILDTYSLSSGERALCAVIGSTGLLEIALNMGSAKNELQAEIKEKIRVSI